MTSRVSNWDGWITYFEQNAANLINIYWDDGYKITPQEASVVARSLAQFQLGESSEGNHVLMLAQRYIAASGDETYLPALKLFIKEEQRHSKYLARFMEQQNLPLAQSDLVDGVFRMLRHIFNLKLSIMAMLTAEIIAVPYYKSLHNATRSPLLRQICAQLLRDEMQHLQFQLDALSQLRHQRTLGNIVVNHSIHCLLFALTILIVWKQHQAVLRVGGYSFPKFWRVNWGRFNHLFEAHAALQPEVAI
jgi:hypothetical protein